MASTAVFIFVLQGGPGVSRHICSFPTVLLSSNPGTPDPGSCEDRATDLDPRLYDLGGDVLALDL